VGDAIFHGRKDRNDLIKACQLKNGTQLDVDPAQTELFSVLAHSFQRRNQTAETTAVHVLNMLAVDQNISGVLNQNGDDSFPDVGAVLGINEATGGDHVIGFH
jgi:hypothetical protein